MHFFICELQKKLGRTEYIRGCIGLYMAAATPRHRQESANNSRNPHKQRTTNARPKLRYYTKVRRTARTTQRNHIEEGSNVQSHQWTTVSRFCRVEIGFADTASRLKTFQKQATPSKRNGFGLGRSGGGRCGGDSIA